MSNLKLNIVSVVYQYGVTNMDNEYLFSIASVGVLRVSVGEVVGLQPTDGDVSLLRDGDKNFTPFEHLSMIEQGKVSDFISDNCYLLGKIGLENVKDSIITDWIIEPRAVKISDEVVLGHLGVYQDEDDTGKVNVVTMVEAEGINVNLTVYKDTPEDIEIAKGDLDKWIEELTALRDLL